MASSISFSDALANDMLAMLERIANFDLIVDVNVLSLCEFSVESVSAYVGEFPRA